MMTVPDRVGRPLSEPMIAAIAARILADLRAGGQVADRLHRPNEPVATAHCASPCYGPSCPKVAQVESQIQAIVAEALGADARPVRFSQGGLAPWQLRKVIAEIAVRLDQIISVKSLAEIASLSAKHFARAFRQSTSLSPHRWIMLQRVERARQLLVETDEPVCIIAAMCGFADQSHLTAVYRKVTGTTPGKERQLKAQHQGFDMEELGKPLSQPVSVMS